MSLTRSAFYVAVGLLLGAAMHVAIVLLVPLFAVDDAWARMGALGRDGAFHMLPPLAPGGADAATRDPQMLEAACRFDLAGGIVRIRASFPDTFWSVGLIDRRGRNVYSFNDSSSEQSLLDLAVISAADFAALGGNLPTALQNAIVAPYAAETGIAVIRVFVPDEASLPAVEAALSAAQCAASG